MTGKGQLEMIHQEVERLEKDSVGNGTAGSGTASIIDAKIEIEDITAKRIMCLLMMRNRR